MFTKKEIIIGVISTISLLVFSHYADAKTRSEERRVGKEC